MKNDTYPNTPNSYSSQFDDGSTNGMSYVEVPGLPGTYPKAPGRLANRATDAESLSYMLEDPSTTPQDVRIMRAVDQINFKNRVIDREEAHLAANYENTLRMAIPAGREALRQSTEAFDAFLDQHGTPEDYLDKNNDDVSSADLQKARQDYNAALGSELIAQENQLYKESESDRAALVDMIGALGERDRQAHADHEAGVDRTAQIAAADAGQFAKYLPPH